MKKRSTGSSAAQSAWCSMYPATILALWARYQATALGRSRKPDQRETDGRLAGPGRDPDPASNWSASHASRSRPSLTARHHSLPGRGASGAASRPRRTCHRMKAISARR